jgi:hypothetical protein
MNRNAFEKLVRQRMTEGGINLDERSFKEFMKTFDSDASFQQFRNRAKGSIKTIQSSSSGTSSSGAVQTYSRTVDTRNTEKKLMDIFTDEWRKNNSGYLTASYMAQGAAASNALGNARYLREKAGGTSGKSGKTGKTNIQYADDSIMAQEKLVSDLTQKWKTASGELRDGYLKDLEEAQKKLAEMTGKAKGDGAPTFTMSQLEGISFDNQIPTTRGNNGRAQDKLDLATAAFATSGTSNVDFSNYTAALQNAIKDANIGSELYAQLSEQLSDSSQVSQLLQQYVANGITGADLGQTAQELKAKLMNGEIDDDVIQQYVDELNAKLMEKFDETEWPNVLITFDADTKNIVNAAQQQEREAQKMAKNWQAAGSAIQAVGAAMNQIEDPAAKVLGTIAQAVATMALSYSQAAASPAVTGTGWGWIAFAATGLATMLTSVNAIKQATSGFANGGVIPGNSLSGDNLRGITPDGTVYGLNSQEIILNRAQQGNLASQLEGGAAAGTESQPYVFGEQIFLGLNSYLMRSGMGEIVTSRNK